MTISESKMDTKQYDSSINLKELINSGEIEEPVTVEVTFSRMSVDFLDTPSSADACYSGVRILSKDKVIPYASHNTEMTSAAVCNDLSIIAGMLKVPADAAKDALAAMATLDSAGIQYCIETNAYGSKVIHMDTAKAKKMLSTICSTYGPAVESLKEI